MLQQALHLLSSITSNAGRKLDRSILVILSFLLHLQGERAIYKRNNVYLCYRWKEASGKNQLRYSESIKILKEMYER